MILTILFWREMEIHYILNSNDISSTHLRHLWSTISFYDNQFTKSGHSFNHSGLDWHMNEIFFSFSPPSCSMGTFVEVLRGSISRNHLNSTVVRSHHVLVWYSRNFRYKSTYWNLTSSNTPGPPPIVRNAVKWIGTTDRTFFVAFLLFCW